ncbi:MAG: DUF2085 domain-containing protein [Clostridia bacterium]|nr:DUF2085 domain-containing protein [Clostridia bacterium]
MKISFYTILWEMGKLSGCHQRADRSFCFRGKQFPVCARCTGAFIGYFSGALIFPFFQLPVWVGVFFCAVMFFDWFIQRMSILHSTNIRRLITGMLCGFGLMHLYLMFIVFLLNTISFWVKV